jgi:hypothetical protein
MRTIFGYYGYFSERLPYSYCSVCGRGEEIKRNKNPDDDLQTEFIVIK